MALSKRKNYGKINPDGTVTWGYPPKKKKEITVSYKTQFPGDINIGWYIADRPKTMKGAVALAKDLSKKYLEADVVVEINGTIEQHDFYKNGLLSEKMI